MLAPEKLIILLSDCKIIQENPTGTVLSKVTVSALPEQTNTLPLYVAAFAELMVILEVTGLKAALKPAMVELTVDDPIIAPLKLTSAKLFVPAKVWAAVVTTPPLDPSAGVKVIVVPLMVAPFAFDVALMDPTEDTPEIAAGTEVQVVPFDVNTFPLVPGASV